jgi:hypothetical protein
MYLWKESVTFLFTKTCCMDTKKFAIGTLVGGIVFFLLGYLVYGLALAGFFKDHSIAPAGAMKAMEQIVWWELIAGNLASGALLTYIFLKMGNVKTFMAGARQGVVIGLFLSLSMGLIRHATEYVSDRTSAIAEVVAETLMTAIAAGIIAAVIGMGKKA